MLNRIKNALGVGGPEVDTVLTGAESRPGGVIEGEVRVTGGDRAREVSGLRVGLVATAEVEHDDGESQQRLVFAETQLAGEGTIEPQQHVALPFRLELPWETPFNVLRGHRFERMRLGVQTRLDLPGGVDATDTDPIDVHPLPIHERAIEGMERLGFTLKGADLEKGRIPGATLPFYNEIEFRGGGRTPEVELTFLTGPERTAVIVEVSRQGLLSAGDRHDRLDGPTHDAEGVDWAAMLGERVQRLAGGRW